MSYSKSYLKITDVGKSFSGKTRIWTVNESEGAGFLLGRISFWPAWRKYVFDPERSVFEEKCLREIADFIEAESKKHRAALKSKKMEKRHAGHS